MRTTSFPSPIHNHCRSRRPLWCDAVCFAAVTVIIGMACACSKGTSTPNDLTATGGAGASSSGTAGVTSGGSAGDVAAGAAGFSGSNGGAGTVGGSSGSTTGGTGGTPSADPVPADWHGWLSDSALWKKVPGGEGCGLYAAEPSQIPVATRVWASCGDGCLVSPIVPAPFPSDFKAKSATYSASATVEQGEFIVRYSLGTTPGGNVVLGERLPSGGLIGGVAQHGKTSSCGVRGGDYSAPRIVVFSDEIKEHVAWFSPPGETRWNLTLPNQGIQSSVFAWDNGFGMTMESGAVIASSPFEASSFSVIDSNNLPSYSSYGRGDLVLWRGMSGATYHTQLKSFTSAGGVKVLLEDPGTGMINKVALSDQRIVWTTVHGPNAQDGGYQSAEVSWSPRVTEPSGIVAHPIPVLATSGLMSLQTGGDFVAMDVCLAPVNGVSPCGMVVVNLVTGQQWKLKPHTASVYSTILAVSPTEVLVGESDSPGDSTLLQRLVRIQTAKLEANSGGW